MNTNEHSTTRLLRETDVLVLRGKKRTSHRADVTKGLFTQPVKIGARAVAWPETEVTTLQKAVIAGKSQAEIIRLVHELHARRAAGNAEHGEHDGM